jgi:hypothetical protein
MTEVSYFTDREFGPRSRTEQEITPRAWAGIVGIAQSLIKEGAFGLDFPEHCMECGVSRIVGNDERDLSLLLRGEIDIEWPLQTVKVVEPVFVTPTTEPYTPPTPLVLDVIEFCHRHVAQPLEDGSYHRHSHQRTTHRHLEFDRQAGQESYRSQVNRVFARNGLAYELRVDGTVERLAPPVLRENLRSAVFSTGDTTLDQLLERARTKFLSHDPNTRRESLEKLWDAWERLKTVDVPADKKLSITKLLDGVATEPGFRAALENEAKELTRIGNNFQIRHTEVGKPPIEEDAHVDYLFHRLFALIWLAIGN